MGCKWELWKGGKKAELKVVNWDERQAVGMVAPLVGWWATKVYDRKMS